MINNFFSSFRCYVHYCMIKRNFFFILLLRSLRHDQEKKFFFSSSQYVQYAMIQKKIHFFHFGTTFNTPWSQEKKLIFYCTAATINKKILFFSFQYHVHYANIFIYLLLPYVTNLSKKSPNDILPRKTCVTYKTFFLRSFSGVLYD